MNFLESVFPNDNNIEVCGLTNELNAFFIAQKYLNGSDSVLVLTNTLFEANKIYNDLVNYVDDVYLFPMDDFLSSVALALSPDLKMKRLETLENIKNKKKSIVVTHLMGYLKFLPNAEKFNDYHFELKVGQKINREKLFDILVKFGYTKESVVTSSGEFASRGFILDVFIIEESNPVRIEFFDDEILSIRIFDPATQLSKERISKVIVKPFNELITSKPSSLYEYLGKPLLFIMNNTSITTGYEHLQNEILNYNETKEITTKHMFNYEDINSSKIIYLNVFSENIKNYKSYDLNSKEIDSFNSDLDLLASFIIKNQKDHKIVFCISNSKVKTKIKSLLSNNDLINMDNILFIEKNINHGFIINDWVVLSENDIDKHIQKNNYKNKLFVGKKINSFDQIIPGDYVVHVSHGVGIYHGVVTLENNGVKKDYLEIDYKGSDKIYLPVEKIETLYKYSDKNGLAPKINNLGGSLWKKTINNLRRKIKDISDDLIKLYTERSRITGAVFNDFPEEDVFALDFPYELTIDQKNSISDINRDLRNAKPMDRLLCGDVGYGKTEVAFRAAFKAVINGYQVAFLCPTTILSNQHYQNTIERFKNFAVNIKLINRFTTKKELELILKGIKSGSVDMVIGTHRLLSSDIIFKNIGLLIVDEEQRFGVTHKEKIKQFKNDVNVLTLTATPIPRTMKMALSGLRDLSLLDTPPVDRYPIQTYVIAQNDGLIKEAIYKELSRNGQVYYLYNKVENIESEVNRLQKLVPEARITFAHGQMSKTELESKMLEFVDYEYDILVCSTIIETGIDISNVNTLIIIDANNFGLSQLYQIRGRVGRSNKIAYAYLMFNEKKMLNDIAIKRLQAIKEFTELGSGYRIAMRDLSIRGAGDLLGSEQAGFIDAVGVDLYTAMVNSQMTGDFSIFDNENNKPLINVNSHISNDYVEDEDVKIEIHRLICEIDSQDSFNSVKHQLEDRFGPISVQLEQYMYEQWFEKICKSIGLKTVNQTKSFIEIFLPPNISETIKADKLFLYANSINPNIKFKYVLKQIIISYPITESDYLYQVIKILLFIENQIKND